jgi:hypothetical protein
MEHNRRPRQKSTQPPGFLSTWFLTKVSKTYDEEKTAEKMEYLHVEDWRWTHVFHLQKYKIKLDHIP